MPTRAPLLLAAALLTLSACGAPQARHVRFAHASPSGTAPLHPAPRRSIRHRATSSGTAPLHPAPPDPASPDPTPHRAAPSGTARPPTATIRRGADPPIRAGAAMAYKPRAAPLAHPDLMSRLEKAIADARRHIPDCLAAGRVDLTTGALLDVAAADGPSRETLSLVAAATRDLFDGPPVSTIEQRIRESRGVPGPHPAPAPRRSARDRRCTVEHVAGAPCGPYLGGSDPLPIHLGNATRLRSQKANCRTPRDVRRRGRSIRAKPPSGGGDRCNLVQDARVQCCWNTAPSTPPSRSSPHAGNPPEGAPFEPSPLPPPLRARRLQLRLPPLRARRARGVHRPRPLPRRRPAVRRSPPRSRRPLLRPRDARPRPPRARPSSAPHRASTAVAGPASALQQGTCGPLGGVGGVRTPRRSLSCA